jgi:hypothetical protein
MGQLDRKRDNWTAQGVAGLHRRKNDCIGGHWPRQGIFGLTGESCAVENENAIFCTGS